MVMSLLNQNLTESHAFFTALYEQIELSEIKVFASAVNLLQEVEQLMEAQPHFSLTSFFIPVDFSAYLREK